MLLALQTERPEVVIDTYASQARAIFSEAYTHGDYTPVIIPSSNGAEDLPPTLASLSLSREPVVPIVIDNNSTDDAGLEIARRFGAITYHIPQGNGNKMAAIQTGLHVAAELGKRQVLLTDDDVLFPTRWSERMNRKLSRGQAAHGVGVFATSITMHGDSPLADFAYTAFRSGRDMARFVNGRVFSARGHNYGLRLDNWNNILGAIDNLDGTIFEGDAHAVLNAVKEAGADIRPTFDPRVAVVTRGDRVSSIRGVVAALVGDARSLSYRRQYGTEYTVYEHSS